jgi:hypothetical protein
LLQYEKDLPIKSKTDIKVQSHDSWEDLLQLATGTLESYNDDSGFCGKMKKMLRKLGDQSAALKAWSNLLPSQSEYFSILCGGLKIIITVSPQACTRLHC